MPPPSPPRDTQRIAKLLARAGIASRREVERMIAEGRIAIDGKPVETPATLLGSLHGVTVDGQPVKAPAPVGTVPWMIIAVSGITPFCLVSASLAPR